MCKEMEVSRTEFDEINWKHHLEVEIVLKNTQLHSIKYHSLCLKKSSHASRFQEFRS